MNTASTPPGTAAGCGGGGGACSTLLVSPKKRVLKTYQSRRAMRGCPGGAVGARNQEKAANSERPEGPRQESEVAIVDVALPPPMVQELVKPKRGRDACRVEVCWAAKKRRSTFHGASDSGNAIAEMSRGAMAAASSSIVQELAGVWVGTEAVHNKCHCLSGGSAAVAVEDEREEEKLWLCNAMAPVHGLVGMRQDTELTVVDLAVPHPSVKKPKKRDHHQNGDDVCWLIKKSWPNNLAIHESSYGVVDQVNMARPSTPPLGIQELASMVLPVREAKAAIRQCRKTTRPSGCKTTKQPFMSLSCRLQCLRVTSVTTILAKVLTPTDCRLDQARLQLQASSVVDSPLMVMLTPYEKRAVHRVSEDNMDGLPLEALDRHGHSYDMTFKFLGSIGAYRLIGEWAKFLAQNDVSSGYLVELGAFRFEGQLVLTLLNHSNKGQGPKKTQARDGAEEEHNPLELGVKGGAVEERISEIEAAECAVEKWTPEEMEAVVSMMELSDFKGRDRP